MSSAIFKVGKVRANGTIHSRVNAATTLPSDIPVVFVDPQNSTANPGDTVTVAVKIFNLTNNAYIASDSPPNYPLWEWGEPLPPPGSRYNFSLGNLYGFQIDFSWNALILDYVNRTVKVPVDTYPDGVLWDPAFLVNEALDDDAGTYTVAYSSIGPTTPVFSCPDDNATVFEMTSKW